MVLCLVVVVVFIKIFFRLTTKLRRKVQRFPWYPLPQHMQSLPHSHQNGPFITTSDPPLTCHTHPKSIVYITVHPWCCVCYGFGEMYNGMYPSHDIIQSIFTALKSSVLIPSFSSPKPWQPLILLFP